MNLFDEKSEPGAALLHRMWRATLQPSSLLTLEETVDALPCSADDAERWLRGSVEACGTIGGINVYRWGEVLEALQQKPGEAHDRTQSKVQANESAHRDRVPSGAASAVESDPPTFEPTRPNETEPKKEITWLSTSTAAKRLGIARSTLDQMVARAPKTLHGAPMLVGAGRKRRHWRWNVDTLETWAAAYREWDAKGGSAHERLVPNTPPERSRRGGSRRRNAATPGQRRSLLSVVTGTSP